MRASDGERERYIEVLREAVAEGRLGIDEFDERLNAAYEARTLGELEPLTRDLPAHAPAEQRPAEVPSRGWAARIGGRRAVSRTGLAILSGFKRAGAWTVPSRYRCFAFWGGGKLDMREAHFEEREVTITVFAVMGGMQLVVPEGVEVDVRGVGIMGGFDQGDGRPGDSGAPRVVVNGLAFWGGVGLERAGRAEDANGSD